MLKRFFHSCSLHSLHASAIGANSPSKLRAFICCRYALSLKNATLVKFISRFESIKFCGISFKRNHNLRKTVSKLGEPEILNTDQVSQYTYTGWVATSLKGESENLIGGLVDIWIISKLNCYDFR